MGADVGTGFCTVRAAGLSGVFAPGVPADAAAAFDEVATVDLAAVVCLPGLGSFI